MVPISTPTRILEHRPSCACTIHMTDDHYSNYEPYIHQKRAHFRFATVTTTVASFVITHFPALDRIRRTKGNAQIYSHKIILTGYITSTLRNFSFAHCTFFFVRFLFHTDTESIVCHIFVENNICSTSVHVHHFSFVFFSTPTPN